MTDSRATMKHLKRNVVVMFFKDIDFAVAEKFKTVECLSEFELADELFSVLSDPELGRDLFRALRGGVNELIASRFELVEIALVALKCWEKETEASVVSVTNVKLAKSAMQSVRLTALGLNGNELGQFCLCLFQFVADLKQVVSSKCGIPVELLHVVGPNGGEPLRDRQPLLCYKLKNGECITCIQLPIPHGFDYVGECNRCCDVRHVFDKYAPRVSKNTRTIQSFCEACGGTVDTSRSPCGSRK